MAHSRRFRLAISNIAWPAESDDEALGLAAGLGFEGIEIAPAKVFGPLDAVEPSNVEAYRSRLAAIGLAIPAMQAILFGTQGAHLFAGDETRLRMTETLERIAAIAGGLGARACVFGAPALRDPGDLAEGEAFDIAARFFRDTADAFARQGAALCFEANPPLYNCRFATRTSDAIRLVDLVAAEGFALQLDTGTIIENREDPAVIGDAAARIGHFHISEPGLPPPGSTGADHSAIAAALGASCYSGWLSIEMKAVPDWRHAMVQAHAFVMNTYPLEDF